MRSSREILRASSECSIQSLETQMPEIETVTSSVAKPDLRNEEPQLLYTASPHFAAAPADVVRMGVIGYGYWGPNIVRNLHGLENARVVRVCDRSASALR